MAASKMLPVLVTGAYLLLLGASLTGPYVSTTVRSLRFRLTIADWLVGAMILLAAIILTIARAGNLILLSLLILVPLLPLGRNALMGGAAALLLFAPVPWWFPNFRFEKLTGALFAFLLLASGLLLWQAVRSRDRDDAMPRIATPMAACFLIGLMAGLYTTPFDAYHPIGLAWHHWGAYLSPVEAWLAGGAPYRDFAVQYGLGPTMLLAGSCGTDCWRGFYMVAIIMNALYFALLAGATLYLTRGRGKAIKWLGLIAAGLSIYVWEGFPSQFAGPVAGPSSSGLRFLPLAALLFSIIASEARSSSVRWPGHIIWLLSLFWSPETGFFASVVWWPYLALRAAGGAPGLSQIIVAILPVIGQCIIALVVGLAGLAALVWLVSAGGATLYDFLAYMQHPPGRIDPNLLGPLWLMVAMILLAVQMLIRKGAVAENRMLYACLLALMATGIYYLSRSHDNNILNLFPFMLLVLLALLRQIAPGERFARRFEHGFLFTTLIAMIVFSATVNLGPWREGSRKYGLVNLGPDRLLTRFSPQPDTEPKFLSDDALAGLDVLRRTNRGGVVLLNYRLVMPRFAAGAGWTGVNNPANYVPLPRGDVERYIQHGAQVYGRPGWLLVQNDKYGGWVDWYRTAYDVREQRQFGRYTAYYLVPRLPPRRH